MQIIATQYYKPRDIARLKLITSSRGRVSHQFVLAKIKSGELEAENRGKGETPYYWVKGSAILAYRKKNNLYLGSENETEPATPVAA